MATMPSAWLRRNILGPCDGGRHLVHVLGHTGLPDIDPELEQYAMDPRRFPTTGLAKLMSRFRISNGTCGLPQRGLGTSSASRLETRSMPSNDGLCLTNNRQRRS